MWCVNYISIFFKKGRPLDLEQQQAKLGPRQQPGRQRLAQWGTFPASELAGTGLIPWDLIFLR